MKTERQTRILSILAEQRIETQDQLMCALKAAGIHATQTTLSRDLDELRVRRELQSDGRRRYTLSSYLEGQARNEKLQRVFRQSVSRFSAAQNLVVIHTLPGLAGGAASAIDALELPSVAGTVAGDDTVFVALLDRTAAEAFCRRLRNMLEL